MTAAYDPTEVERLIETVRRIANIKRKPCPDCSCYACADCHCSLEHARRDREPAVADQLEAARVRIAELEAQLVGHPTAPLAPGDSVVLEVDGRIVAVLPTK